MNTLASFLIGWLLAGPALAEQVWHLMSRHGECTAITDAMRYKIPGFPSVRTPEAFVKPLNDRGLKVELTAPRGTQEGQLIAKIPARGWSLLVVRQAHCSNFGTGPK